MCVCTGEQAVSVLRAVVSVQRGVACRLQQVVEQLAASVGGFHAVLALHQPQQRHHVRQRQRPRHLGIYHTQHSLETRSASTRDTVKSPQTLTVTLIQGLHEGFETLLKCHGAVGVIAPQRSPRHLQPHHL